ncbi:hypothetical protein T10_1845 [Trichinella papuae]|uniref:Uncharacterized protein n=1 Tax=Trichinella papuae TaxID=268474 RepID=A0A0V1MB53_9BILA|nr:hypothetical protein T10_1845 [Trichinella papuae]
MELLQRMSSAGTDTISNVWKDIAFFHGQDQYDCAGHLNECCRSQGWGSSPWAH